MDPHPAAKRRVTLKPGMDPHPDLIPAAKRRVTLKPTMLRSKTSKREPQMQPDAPAKTRPKRAFGVSRNTNIPLEKVQLKPQKPANAIANPAKKNATATENVKVNPTERKKQPQQVHLKEQNGKKQEEAIRTPLAVAKKVVEDGTPYLSALNCSKCRLDQLETSSYWLNQIRLSEGVGKHFVSATFFRLALECHAQPFEKIRSELKHYTKRHQAISTISLFDELLQSYGLSAMKTKSESTETLVCESKKEALSFDSEKDEHEKKTDASMCEIVKLMLKEEHGYNSNQGLYSDISRGEPKAESSETLVCESNKEALFFDSERDEHEKKTVASMCGIENLTLKEEHGSNSNQGLFSDISLGEPKAESSETLVCESKKEALLFDSERDEHEKKTDASMCEIENLMLKEEHGCNSNQGLYSNISRGEPNSEQKQDEIEPDHGEVESSDPIEEVSAKLKQAVLKDCSNSASEKKAVKKSNKKSPPIRGSLYRKKGAITCSEKSNSTNKTGSGANLHEQGKSKGKQAVKNEMTKCVSKTKDEEPVKDEVEVSLTDSQAT